MVATFFPFSIFFLFFFPLVLYVVKVYTVHTYILLCITKEGIDQLPKCGDLQKFCQSPFSYQPAAQKKVNSAAAALTLLLSYSCIFQTALSNGLSV